MMTIFQVTEIWIVNPDAFSHCFLRFIYPISVCLSAYLSDCLSVIVVMI